MQFGAHGTTFGGNPLAAAVARAALRELSSPALLANVARQSLAIRDALAALDAELGLFSEIRGRGLMLGAQLREAHAGKAGRDPRPVRGARPAAAAGRARTCCASCRH